MLAASATKSMETRTLKSQEISNAAWAYATAGHAAPRLFDVLATTAEAKVTQFNPQELSNLAWAFATNEHDAPQLFDALAAATKPNVSKFNPQNLAITAWAFATADHSAPSLFDALADAGTQTVSKFNPQNLANMVWAFSTLGHAAPELYNAVAMQVASRVGDFKPQELANMAWAYAAAGHRSAVLYEALAETAAVRGASGPASSGRSCAPVVPSPTPALILSQVRGVSDFKPQAVANTAWSYAFAGVPAPELFDALASVGKAQSSDFQPRSLSNLAWAFAAAGHQSPALLDALAEVAAEMAARGEFRPSELVNVAWAFASFGHKAPALFDAMSVSATELAADFEPNQISMILWSFATISHSSPSMFDALAHVSAYLARVEAFGPRNLANTAWAYASSGRSAPELFDALAQAASAGGLARFQPAHLARLAWAYAAADHPSPTLFNSAFAARIEEIVWEDNDQLAQLHQWQLWHQERGLPSPLSTEFGFRCQTGFMCASIEAPSQAGSRPVAAALTELGLAVKGDVVVECGHRIDLEVEWRGDRLGILVEGPNDFMSGTLQPSSKSAHTLHLCRTSTHYWPTHAHTLALSSDLCTQPLTRCHALSPEHRRWCVTSSVRRPLARPTSQDGSATSGSLHSQGWYSPTAAAGRGTSQLPHNYGAVLGVAAGAPW